LRIKNKKSEKGRNTAEKKLGDEMKGEHDKKEKRKKKGTT